MVQHRWKPTRLAKTHLPAKGSDLSEEEAIRPEVHFSVDEGKGKVHFMVWDDLARFIMAWHPSSRAGKKKQKEMFHLSFCLKLEVSTSYHHCW